MKPLSSKEQKKMKFHANFKTMRTNEAEEYLANVKHTLKNVLSGDDITFRLYYLDVDLFEQSFKLSISYNCAKDSIYSYDERGKRYDHDETVNLLKHYYKEESKIKATQRREKMHNLIRKSNLRVVED